MTRPSGRVVLLRYLSVALLRRPVVGRGGFQSLLRRLQAGLRGRALTVTDADLDRLVRYCAGPVGGFQRRLRAVIVDYLAGRVFVARPLKVAGPRRVRPQSAVNARVHPRD